MTDNVPGPHQHKRSLAAIGIAYIIVGYGLSFLLPAYQLGQAPVSAGWEAFWHPVNLVFSARLPNAQRPQAVLMVLANVACWYGLLAGVVHQWGRAAVAALLALLGGGSCLLNPDLRLAEFRVGYWVWLASFAALAALAWHQWRIGKARRSGLGS